MKKLLGLALLLAALAVVVMGMVGFPKIDVNIWPLFPVLLFAFFTAGVLACLGLSFLLPDKESNK